MRHHKPRRAIALAAIALIAGLVLWTRTGDDSNAPHTATGPANPAAHDPEPGKSGGAAVSELATSGPTSRESAVELDGIAPAGYIARERPRALQVARRFLDGYFAFEVRENWRWGARQVAATATAELASDLLAGGAALPPVMDEMPPQAAVYAIDIEFDKPPTTAQIRAEVKRGSDRSDIGVIAHREETQWVITQITE
jgi:hypothetical protein